MEFTVYTLTVAQPRLALQRRLLQTYFSFKLDFTGERADWIQDLVAKQKTDNKLQEAINTVFTRYANGVKMPRQMEDRVDEAITLLLHAS